MKIKNILLIMLTLALLVGLISCTTPSGNADDGNENTDNNSSDNAGDESTPFAPDLNALRDKMIADFGAVDPVKFESELLLDLYGIAAADVAESACYMTMDGVFPDEIVMIKASSADAAARISAALETRLSEVKLQSESYDPDNYALAQKCKVASRDLYVTLFLSPNFDLMTQLFNSAK